MQRKEKQAKDTSQESFLERTGQQIKFCRLPEVEGGGFVPVAGDNMRWSSWAGRQHGKQWAGLCAGQRGPKGLGGGGKALINPVQ